MGASDERRTAYVYACALLRLDHAGFIALDPAEAGFLVQPGPLWDFRKLVSAPVERFLLDRLDHELETVDEKMVFLV